MKKQKNILLVGVALLVVFIAVSVVTFWQSNKLIERGYLAAEGSAAQNFALLTASNIHLSDADVARLKSYTYAELHASADNETLRAMMDNDSFTRKVDYAYVMVHLPPEQVRYQVTAETEERFGMPAGTPLDILWLLDVNVSEGAAETAQDFYGEQTDETAHYSAYIPDDEIIFEQAPLYLYNSSAWGDHICGYAPLYSTEGNYIGVVGIELQTGDYNAYRNTAMFAMGILMGVSTLTLTLLVMLLYVRYNKQQLERIYTDPLTKIHNRSYYNDCFIKQMRVGRVPGQYFALMIADIDWFKKVNDTFGHETGDEVLMEVSELLTEYFGRAQVVRFGGEEFVVGIWYQQEADLRKKLDGLYARLAAQTFTRKEVVISLSLGCSYYRPAQLHGWLLSGMLRAADCELYKAKGNGRKQYRIVEYDETKTYEKK